MLTIRRVVSNALKASVALWVAFWPVWTKAAYLELAPGGTVTIGTSFENTEMIWVAIIRLALGVLILFLIIRFLLDSYALYMTSNADVESSTIDSLWSVGKIIAIVIVASFATPYAVNVLFNVINGGLSPNFG